MTVKPIFPFPLTKVILTIDLLKAWMAFPSILGCHCCSQTELFNSVCQCCFRPHLLGKALKTITLCSLFYHTIWTVGLSAIPLLLVTQYKMYSKKLSFMRIFISGKGRHIKKCIYLFWLFTKNLELLFSLHVYHIGKLPQKQKQTSVVLPALWCDVF